ncbi:MAG: shikimate kinase [Bacteroidota bacterium]
MNLVLIGYMGSGKTSVGKELARSLNFTFTDLDSAIENSLGMTISEIFASKGEIFFRKQEAEVLKEVLSDQTKLVLATGGGTPCYGTVMQDLSNRDHTTTIYLKNNLDILTKRLFQEKEHRPLIAHLETEELLNDFLRKHLFERTFYYNQADYIINCDELTVTDIVENILLKLF